MVVTKAKSIKRKEQNEKLARLLAHVLSRKIKLGL